MRPLEGQTALITGASSGIGEDVARALAAAGAGIGVNYFHHGESAERLVAQVNRAGGKAVALEADVSREDQVIAMFERLIHECGTVDILVSNAGMQNDSPFAEMT